MLSYFFTENHGRLCEMTHLTCVTELCTAAKILQVSYTCWICSALQKEPKNAWFYSALCLIFVILPKRYFRNVPWEDTREIVLKCAMSNVRLLTLGTCKLKRKMLVGNWITYVFRVVDIDHFLLYWTIKGEIQLVFTKKSSETTELYSKNK